MHRTTTHCIPNPLPYKQDRHKASQCGGLGLMVLAHDNYATNHPSVTQFGTVLVIKYSDNFIHRFFDLFIFKRRIMVLEHHRKR